MRVTPELEREAHRLALLLARSIARQRAQRAPRWVPIDAWMSALGADEATARNEYDMAQRRHAYPDYASPDNVAKAQAGVYLGIHDNNNGVNHHDGDGRPARKRG
jgi:hypothetical protein